METLLLPATMESLETCRLFVLEKLQELDVTQEITFKVELVLEEVLTNVIHYAYPAATGEMEIGCSIEADRSFCFVIRDWGVPFNPLERSDPELSGDLSKRQVGGLGIHLVRHMVDELSYQRQDGSNILTFCFHL
jgi:anti-sigma regulatory factor (Ser/Thr protein kinase)